MNISTGIRLPLLSIPILYSNIVLFDLLLISSLVTMTDHTLSEIKVFTIAMPVALSIFHLIPSNILHHFGMPSGSILVSPSSSSVFSPG